MKEKKLVFFVLKNNQKAIKIFWEKYRYKLLYFISRKVPDYQDAEEILQDTFISALDSLPAFRFKSSLYTWLCQIARHEIADFYRKKKLKTIIFSRFPFLEQIVDKALSPELALQEKQAKEKINQILKNLTEGYSQILRLKYLEGKTLKEIARKFDKSIKAVESKLARARKAFKEQYVRESYISKFKIRKNFSQIKVFSRIFASSLS